MTSSPSPRQDAELSWKERMARYDEIQANNELRILNASRRHQEIGWAPWQIVLTVFAAAAAFFTAGGVLVKLFQI